MGLPMKKLIVPVNDNDAFPRFLASGQLSESCAVAQLSFERDERGTSE